MAGQVITIPKLQDKNLIICFQQIEKKLNKVSNYNANLFGGIKVNLKSDSDEDKQLVKALLKQNSFHINTATFSVAGFSFTYYRGGSTEPKSAFIDEVIIGTNQNNQLTTLEIFDVISIVTENLKSTELTKGIGKKSKEEEELAAIHESTLNRLESLNESLINETHNYRKKLDEEYLEKEKSLNEEISSKKLEIQATHQVNIEEINTQKEEIEIIRKDLDDKSNTHARRQIRKDIINEIKSRQTKFKLTDGTNKLRSPVGIAMVSLILFFVVMTILSIRDFYSLSLESNILMIIIALGKQILFSAGAVASFIFFIKWQNKWFEKHSVAEFDLKQFELDMERASWIVETALEWKEIKGNKIPVELLNSLTKNLFNDESKVDEVLAHPADHLASALLGASSKVKLKTDGAEVEINPSKIKN